MNKIHLAPTCKQLEVLSSELKGVRREYEERLGIYSLPAFAFLSADQINQKLSNCRIYGSTIVAPSNS